MRKILGVLMLLLVASLAYSVGGSLYMRYNSDGTVTATEWGLLDDLRVGRRGTGFDLNFDAFTLSYKLRSSVNLGEWQMNGALNDVNKAFGVDAYSGAKRVTSPGYLQFSGLKAGPANLSLGLAWWHWDYSYSQKIVPTSGTTTESKKSGGANIIGVDFTMDLPISESFRLHIDPWDKLDLYIGLGDADVKDGADTNTAKSSYFKVILPVHFNMDFGTVGLEIFPKITFISYGGSYALSSGETNNNSSSQLVFGIMGRLNILINEFLGAFVHAGYVYDDSITLVNSTLGTNTNGATTMEVPIFAGLTVKPAGPILLTLGVGYLLKLADIPKGAPSETNLPAGGLVGEYGYFDEHGYQNPFLRFAGSAKFASDWEIGMSTILYWNQKAIATQGGSGSYYSGGVKIASGGMTTTYESEILHFNYFNDWDGGGNGFGANYLQFSKDNVTIRGHITGGGGLWGLFGFADVSFAF
ncbi:MAG: hypothetical protein ACP5QT_04855 [Brevinematia bacterium]